MDNLSGYEPKTEHLDNSWHERGELPPVGSIVEYDDCGRFVKTKILAHHPKDNCVWHECVNGSFSGRASYSTDSPQAFRPIKTEREKFIDAALAAAKKHGAECDVTFAEAMLKEGFRAPENKAPN